MPWSDLLGHEAAVASLRRALASGRLHHGLLLHGSAGTGKHTAARLLAQALCCTSLSRLLSPPEDETPSLFGFDPAPSEQAAAGASPLSTDPCGVCAACRRIQAGMHPDVREVTFVPNPSTGKMRTEIVISQIRELSDYLTLRPLEAQRRVAIVDPADRMNPAAANAFLKTLEEPPSGAIIVLVARNRHALLPTIRSRCRPVIFGRVPVASIEAALIRRGVSERDAVLAACLGDGAPGRSFALAASVGETTGEAGAPAASDEAGAASTESPIEAFRERRERVLAALELAAGTGRGTSRGSVRLEPRGLGRGSRALQAAESFSAKDNEEFAACLDITEMLLRDALLISTGAAASGAAGAPGAPVAMDPALCATADDPARLLPLADALGARRAAACIERAAAIRSETGSNSNKQLAIECLLAELGA